MSIVFLMSIAPVKGPNPIVFFSTPRRTMSISGYGSLVICTYRKLLSSFISTLNFGFFSLIRFVSSMSASSSEFVTVISKSAICSRKAVCHGPAVSLRASVCMPAFLSGF